MFEDNHKHREHLIRSKREFSENVYKLIEALLQIGVSLFVLLALPFKVIFFLLRFMVDFLLSRAGLASVVVLLIGILIYQQLTFQTPVPKVATPVLNFQAPNYLTLKRKALLIGNADYQQRDLKLKNPINDIELIQKRLEKLNFEVTPVTNISDKQEWREALKTFIKELDQESLALFYYAGHGGQGFDEDDKKWRDYLIPTKAPLEFAADIAKNGISLDFISSVLNEKQPKLIISLVDACRKQLVQRFKGNTTRGMVQAPRSDGPQLQLFSTQANELADDGSGKNSPFARALNEALNKPGLDALHALNEVVKLVPKYAVPPEANNSDKKQHPSLVPYHGIPDVCLTGSCFSGAIKETALSTGTVRKDPLMGSEFVWIAPDCFEVGSPETEKALVSDERKHQHRVCLKQGYWIAKTEVTVGQFRRFVESENYKTEAERDVGVKGCYNYDEKANKWDYRAGVSWRKPGYDQGEEHPVVCVSWHDAQAYIGWLNRQGRQHYRLPTEAEWEYAARGGTKTAYYWSNAVDERACDYGNVADSGQGWNGGFPCDDGYRYTAPIGHYRANDFGLYDMLGNVWEWTCSGYDEKYEGGELSCLSNNDADSIRVLRGGSWDNDPHRVRSAGRSWNRPANRCDNVGFRLVQD